MSASAARAEDDKVYIDLVNLNPDEPAEVTTQLEGVDVNGAKGRILTASEMDARNTFDKPEAVKPEPFQGQFDDGELVFKLPPKSGRRGCC